MFPMMAVILHPLNTSNGSRKLNGQLFGAVDDELFYVAQLSFDVAPQVIRYQRVGEQFDLNIMKKTDVAFDDDACELLAK